MQAGRPRPRLPRKKVPHEGSRARAQRSRKEQRAKRPHGGHDKAASGEVGPRAPLAMAKSQADPGRSLAELSGSTGWRNRAKGVLRYMRQAGRDSSVQECVRSAAGEGAHRVEEGSGSRARWPQGPFQGVERSPRAVSVSTVGSLLDFGLWPAARWSARRDVAPTDGGHLVPLRDCFAPGQSGDNSIEGLRRRFLTPADAGSIGLTGSGFLPPAGEAQDD